MVDKFIEILKEEKNIYQNLLELAKSKQKFIIENNIVALEEITKEEGKSILVLTRIGSERAKFIDENPDIFGTEDEGKSFDEILRQIPADERETVAENAKELREIVNELKGVNDMNTELVNQALKMINASIGIIGEGNNKGNYSRENKRKQEFKNLFDKKI